MLPVPVLIGIALITLGVALGIYIIVASLRDRQHVKPINDDEN